MKVHDSFATFSGEVAWKCQLSAAETAVRGLHGGRVKARLERDIVQRVA